MKVTDYLTVAQAAERRGVSRQTIYSAIRRGRLSSTQILGKPALRPGDVDALVIFPQNKDRQGQVFPGGKGRPKSRKETLNSNPTEQP